MSRPYPKINSVWKRDERGQILTSQISTPEIELLKDIDWLWTEKVDGTNIRITHEQGAPAHIQGRTDKADIPTFLFKTLSSIADAAPFEEVFGEHEYDSITLYGEGYGARIQGVGSQYIPDGTDFVLFDVLVSGPEKDWWLRRKSVEEVGEGLGLRVAPVVLQGSIAEAVWTVREGFKSAWEGVEVPEGLVGKPLVDLFTRDGSRIITKVKHKDLTNWPKELEAL